MTPAEALALCKRLRELEAKADTPGPWVALPLPVGSWRVVNQAGRSVTPTSGVRMAIAPLIAESHNALFPELLDALEAWAPVIQAAQEWRAEIDHWWLTAGDATDVDIGLARALDRLQEPKEAAR